MEPRCRLKKRQKGPSSRYFSSFYIWSINSTAKITKTSVFLAHFAAVFIFHSLPVLMGLILVSAMITPSVGIHYRVHNSHPEPSHPCLTPISPPPPHHGATNIHSQHTAKSKAAGFQIHCTSQRRRANIHYLQQ